VISERLVIPDPEAVFSRFVASIRFPLDHEDCWIWARRIDGDGYGELKVDGRRRRAHRVSFALHYGEATAGLTIDHLCRTRACVNPLHLEEVDNATNVLRGAGRSAVNARKTECDRGHPYDEANTAHDTNGGRYCRLCDRSDAVRSGRSRREQEALIRRPRLVGNGGPSMTEDEAMEILQRRAEGATYAELTAEFRVGYQAVSRLCRGISWKHVPRPAALRTAA
jgi:hypothetical protein